MLCRVAERVYWLGRYLERSEDTARLVNVYTHMLLDIPRSFRLSWDGLIDIISENEAFSQRYQNTDERNVIKFILADESNPGSILNSLTCARENARTTRDILPVELWEQINDLYYHAAENAIKAVTRGSRHGFLQTVVGGCQRITGLLFDCMSHDSPFLFARMGQNLERAEMSTRMLNVGASNLFINDAKQANPGPNENVVWISILHSLSGFLMYRQHVYDRAIAGERVVEFLLKDMQFPRAVGKCLYELEQGMKQLPRNDMAVRHSTRLRRRIARTEFSELVNEQLLDLIDSLQKEFAKIHNRIALTWFDVSKPAGR